MRTTEQLMKACQIGCSNLNDANSLLAECYGRLGRLNEENERLRKDAGRIEWQPIATAPRDGTKIVVIGNNYGDRKQGTHICIASCIDGLFYHENDDIEMNVDSGFFLEHLTHWMPLPEPMP